MGRKWIIIFILAGILIILFFLKFKMFFAADNDMLPTAGKGKLILVNKKSSANFKIGDVIAFKRPDLADVKIGNKDNDFSRLVALPGDTLLVYMKKLYVNSERYEFKQNLFYQYRLSVNDDFYNTNLQSEDFYNLTELVENRIMELNAGADATDDLEAIEGVENVRLISMIRGQRESGIFPTSPFHAWNRDYYGPVLIPRKDEPIEIDYQNISLYKRLITVYENHELYIDHREIFIDGNKVNRFVPSQNYYFVLDDNRDAAHDSRYIGFIPEDHILGLVKKHK